MREALYSAITNVGLLTIAEYVMMMPLLIMAVWAGWRAMGNVRRWD